MDEILNKSADEAAAFQRIWLETISRVMQAGLTVPPNSPPPEMARQFRSGVFQALANSWEEFMHSPQFLQNMKQWMEAAVAFRKLSNEVLSRMRTELQAPARADVDILMLTVRHMEKRLLDRLDELSGEITKLKEARPSKVRASRRRAKAARPHLEAAGRENGHTTSQ